MEQKVAHTHSTKNETQVFENHDLSKTISPTNIELGDYKSLCDNQSCPRLCKIYKTEKCCTMGKVCVFCSMTQLQNCQKSRSWSWTLLVSFLTILALIALLWMPF